MTRAKATQPKLKKEKKPKPLTPIDIMKLEIAEELGLLDKVKEVGWADLTASETGRIGGIMNKRMRAKGLIPPS